MENVNVTAREYFKDIKQDIMSFLSYYDNQKFTPKQLARYLELGHYFRYLKLDDSDRLEAVNWLENSEEMGNLYSYIEPTDSGMVINDIIYRAYNAGKESVLNK